MENATAREMEFEFTDRDFEFLRSIVTSHTGITLGGHKRQLVYGRLTRRLRQLNISTFSQYCVYVEQHLNDELGELVNAITTNLTSFFRENHHFEHLAESALPDRMDNNGLQRRLRLWSAGCSTGEEPYSIAMTVAETLGSALPVWDVRILATDIDSQVLARAANGVYTQDRIEGISGARQKRWFRRGAGPNQGKVRMDDALRSLISFKQLNLMDEAWPMRGPFDIIFCRNVVIYFDKPTQKKLFDRYADLLAPGGYLYVGHSESLHGTSTRFRLIGRTIYQKAD
ncbi:MAG: protein-glutamate O-methyltransferase CheR [Gammaproteobacteria bacterium]|nr:protein-glutamate O-methyltransferase CheR [Gammaproteobacteria bacterium]